MRYLYLITSLLLFYITAFSQSMDLEPVLVSSSLQEKKKRESGRNIIFLTKEDIQKIPGNSLDEILRFVPGIEVQMRGPAGSQADFVFRGGTFQQVLVLIDGIRMNEPLTGHFNSYIPVVKEEIQRIEILKGAAASLFGPDAVGGVIHIITQKAFDKEKERALHASLQRGSYGLSQQTLSMGISNPKTHVFAGVQYNKVNGEELRGTRGFVKTGLYAISASRKLSGDWNMHVRFAVDRRNFNAQNFYTGFVSDTASENVNSTWQQASVSKVTSKKDYYLLFGARQLEDEYRFRPKSIANNNRTRLLNADLRQVNKYKWQQARWTNGIQASNKIIQSNDRGNHTHQHAGLYSVLFHQPLKGLFLTEGLRLDWDRSYQWNFVPQFNFSYVMKNISLRGSIAKGVRDADFTERFNNYKKTGVTGGRIGNPDLKAEKSLNMELGADLFGQSPVQLHFTLFRRNQSNLIDWVNTTYNNMPRRENLIVGGIYALALNVASVQTTGAELDINGAHQLSSQLSIRWNTGLTLVKAAATNDVSSLYLSNYARVIWNSNIQLTHTRGLISISTLMKRREAQTTNVLIVPVSKSFSVVNLRADIYLWNKKTTLFFQADNFFNVKYADFIGAKMPGRWLSTGISLNL